MKKSENTSSRSFSCYMSHYRYSTDAHVIAPDLVVNLSFNLYLSVALPLRPWTRHLFNRTSSDHSLRVVCEFILAK